MFNTIKVNNTDTNYTHSIFDISEYTGKTYETISDALTDIPDEKQKGGMTVSFISSTSDNEYVQYKLVSDTFSTTESDWQSMNVDDVPTVGSDNLVKSGGVKNSIEHSKFSEFNKKNIEKIYSDLLYTFDWAVGTINATTGEYQNSTSAQREFICTPNIVTLLENTIISRDDGNVAYYYKFSEGVFVERKQVSANDSTLPAGQYKFSIKNNTQSIERTTIYELLLNIHSNKTVGILKPFIDNTNYAIDTIDAINENVDNLRTVVNSIKEDSIYLYPWTIGSTSSSTGEYNPNARDRITTPTIVTLTKETTFTVDDGWTLYAFSYLNGEYTGAYSTTSGTNRTIPVGQRKFTVVKNENPTILKSIYPPLSHLQSDDVTRDTFGLDKVTIEEGSVWE